MELVLAVTLPFKKQDVSRSLFERAIDQTQTRWAWFAESRELDTEFSTELGTLGYLPWEIRQQILKVVLDGHYCYQSLYSSYLAEEHGPAPQILCYDVEDPLREPTPDVFYLAAYQRTREEGFEITPYPKTVVLQLSSPARLDDEVLAATRVAATGQL